MESCFQLEIEEDRRKYIFSLLKVFELFKKNFLKYIEGVWGFFFIDWKGVMMIVFEIVIFNVML